MTGKTHVAIGIATALTISIGQPPEEQLVLVLTSVIGSLIPDLDHPKGKLNQKLLLINNNFYRALFYSSLGFIFMYLYFLKGIRYFLLLGIVSFLIGISNHRGFTHSILGFLASASIVGVVTLKHDLPNAYSGFIIGYALHLIADFFTPKGIKLFYPLNVNVSSPITIKTGSGTEKIIFMLLGIYSICLLLRYLEI